MVSRIKIALLPLHSAHLVVCHDKRDKDKTTSQTLRMKECVLVGMALPALHINENMIPDIPTNPVSESAHG